MSFKSFTLFTLLLSAHLSAQQFTNPVIPGDFPDPTIIRVGEKYYASGTSSDWSPQYPIFESVDLINWKQISSAFKVKPEWTKSSFWAPEFYVLNGKIFLYYTARRASDNISFIGVASTDDIKKGFTDHGCLVPFGREAIDAFVFEDNGKHYITWKAYGLDERPIELLCQELSPDGIKLVGEPFTLLKDDEGIGMEGQYIYRKGDYYYIIYSILDCCSPRSDYAVSVARSKSFKGPYEKYAGNPILEGDGDIVQSCGHGTAVETPDGRMFYLFHAYMKGMKFSIGRQGFLKELAMNDEKWPYFVTGKYALVNEPIPFANTSQTGITVFEDRFEGTELRPEWTWNSPSSDVHIKIENNTLFLSGTPKDNNNNGTILALRALKPDYEFMTEIKDRNGIFSGLALNSGGSLIIFGKENGNIILKQIRRDTEQILYQKPESGNIHFKIIVSDVVNSSFQWSSDKKNWNPVPLESENNIPQSNRSFRPGLIHIGAENIPAEFTYFNLTYK